MDQHKILKFFRFDTAGWIAGCSLLLCALSGVLLSIPYDFTHPYSSIAQLLLFNPAGTLIRNFHYWSAQLFFIFTMLHVYDHLQKSTETNIRKRRTWLIMCVAIAFLGYEMISGFILKGDAAGIQARRILTSLLEAIPFVGRLLSSALTGTGENGQVVYIQHVATGTLFLLVAVYEHVKTIWHKRRSWLIVFFSILVISLFFRAPLGMAESSEVKGPWFFVGIQEMLHLTSYPLLIFLLLVIFLIILYLIPVISTRKTKVIKRLLLAVGILYLVLTLVVLFFRGENWEWKTMEERRFSGEQLLIFDPVSFTGSPASMQVAENQKTESCLLCHAGMKGLSESHQPKTTGCVACHKGDPFSNNKFLAHRKMILVPGNFSNVRQTCGTQNCHQDITGRMEKSLMTTQSGIIAVDKFVFGETTSLNDTFDVKKLGHTAADTHLRNLCAGCHLGAEKTKTGNAEWLERGGGCNACHLHYNKQAADGLKLMQSGVYQKGNEIHPSIDIQVSNDQCLSCHSRSGRISLTYEGWNETDEGAILSQSVKTKTLPDKRVVEFVQADIHHERGMACIDCHGSYDLMGDDKHQVHKEDAVSVQCADCHTSGKLHTVAVAALPDKESQMIAWLRKSASKSRVILTAKNQRPLMNTFADSLDRVFLTSKLTGKIHPSKPQASVCAKGKGHSRLSCEACHTAWVPQCIGCHNSFENGTPGIDLLTRQPTANSWVEFAGKNLPEPPVLGVNTTGDGRVVPAMPGMVMTIDLGSFTKGKGKNFHRLYAPASGHTTRREGRTCKSCHNDPLAIGFGRGELVYKVLGATGKWNFTPRFALNENDHLPEDAWTGFLQEANTPNSTRLTLRPFSVAEQKRILLVGSCLSCHEEKSKVMEMALEDFEPTLAKRSRTCIAPGEKGDMVK